MTRFIHRAPLPPDEIQLLDAEIFEAPRRLTPMDACRQTGSPNRFRPLDADEPWEDQ